MSISFPVRLLLLFTATAVAACVPKLGALAGAPAPAVLPKTELPAGHRLIVFDWQLDDRDMSGRGEGAARIAGPDSARLDLTLAGGFGSGTAILIGDSLYMPGGGLPRRFIPPPPLMWAALGRVAVPAEHDTTARVDGELLRVDIGSPPSWRLTFRHDSLVRLERVRNGRIAEWIERNGAVAHYRSEEARRDLLLTIKRVQEVPAFDAAIWGPF
ncbi:MAG TPA: hypothetical protein VGJ18_20450 [Gemmatimonadaceae bacterium]|jgi:hypothetical protein